MECGRYSGFLARRWERVYPCAFELLLLGFFICFVPRTRAADVVFVSYNLENYFQASDFPSDTAKTKVPSKSSESIAAEIHVLQDIHPDILGVCEMGPPAEFAGFRDRLKAAGLDYSNIEYVNGPDPQRHVALLSRFPITTHQSVKDLAFNLHGQEEKVRRGILDVTIDVEGTKLRFIGVHLKSKLVDTRESEEELRMNEAQLLREHVDAAIDQDGAGGLVVYGDFNATKNEPAMRAVMGVRNSAHALRDLWLKDSVGDTWTEYWKYADIYSRIDYILVTPPLMHDVDSAKSYIYRSPYWSQASDHRPLVATFHFDRAR